MNIHSLLNKYGATIGDKSFELKGDTFIVGGKVVIPPTEDRVEIEPVEVEDDKPPTDANITLLIERFNLLLEVLQDSGIIAD